MYQVPRTHACGRTASASRGTPGYRYTSVAHAAGPAGPTGPAGSSQGTVPLSAPPRPPMAPPGLGAPPAMPQRPTPPQQLQRPGASPLAAPNGAPTGMRPLQPAGAPMGAPPGAGSPGQLTRPAPPGAPAPPARHAMPPMQPAAAPGGLQQPSQLNRPPVAPLARPPAMAPMQAPSMPQQAPRPAMPPLGPAAPAPPPAAAVTAPGLAMPPSPPGAMPPAGALPSMQRPGSPLQPPLTRPAAAGPGGVMAPPQQLQRPPMAPLQPPRPPGMAPPPAMQPLQPGMQTAQAPALMPPPTMPQQLGALPPTQPRQPMPLQQPMRPAMQPLQQPGMPVRPMQPLQPRPPMGAPPGMQQLLTPPTMAPPAGGAGAAAPGSIAAPPSMAPPAMGPPGTSAPGLMRPPAGMQSISLQRPARPDVAEGRSAAGSPGAGDRDQTEGGVKKVVRMVKAGKLGMLEVVEEDGADALPDDDEEEDGPKGKGAKGVKGAKGAKEPKKGKKEKVTAEMKRKARQQREQERAEKALAQRREKEEIFEVGEEGMSLEELADAIQVDSSDIVRSLFMKGIMLSMNQVLDKNTVKLVGQEYGLLVVDKDTAAAAAEAGKKKEFLAEEDLDEAVPRPPVVTVMGHVDHGKTSLLDYIRKAKVAAGEAGGITQAIGAYNVEVQLEGESKTICFLDTPGHEAFSAMRARGARVTDVAIIIVAADDGVQPQTREAISHAQAAGVPIVVAINKIDKPGADPDRAKNGLLELNLVPEEWGGSTPMVNVSAKKGVGIEELLQTVAWVAEEQQLMANPKKLAAGTVIEAHLDKKRGAVATLLVQAGTLRVGDIVCAGGCYGKVRSMSTGSGSSPDSAGPSIAVQMVGLNAVPQAGDEFQVYKSEADARSAADTNLEGLRAARMAEMTASGSMVTLSSLATFDEDTDTLQRINLIIKGDTSGVVEAIKGALQGLPQDSVVLRYLLAAAGDITTSDVDLAAASGGMVIGFNVQPDEAVAAHAKQLGVIINSYNVIYNLIDDVKAAMEGKLRTVEERIPSGTAEVKAVFGSGKRKVAGCMVTSGKLIKGELVEVRRGKEVVHSGKLDSLRRVKDNVDEVQEGVECGLGVGDWAGWQEGDKIECFRVVTKAQRLEEAKAATIVDVSTLA